MSTDENCRLNGVPLKLFAELFNNIVLMIYENKVYSTKEWKKTRMRQKLVSNFESWEDNAYKKLFLNAFTHNVPPAIEKLFG